MKSFKKLAYIADKFEAKIKRAQSLTGEDPKAVTADAFFDPKGGKDETVFQNAILAQGSAFMTALPETVKTCLIGATVDAAAKTGDFLVSCQPAVAAGVLAQIKNALISDYTKLYGKAPAARIAAKVAAGSIKPPTLKISAPDIIKVT